MNTLSVLGCAVIFSILVVIFSSNAEWALHRFIMHRPLLGFNYAYEAHAKIHHVRFGYEQNYVSSDEKEDRVKKIPMAWWNGFVICAIGTPIFMGLVYVLTYPFNPHLGFRWWIFCYAVMYSYYLVYEYIHWCMHLPKSRKVEMIGVFRWLNGHHLLHHRYMKKNFNVVLPLADWMWGTLKLLADTKFAQPFGPAIPNVQPRQAALKRG